MEASYWIFFASIQYGAFLLPQGQARGHPGAANQFFLNGSQDWVLLFHPSVANLSASLIFYAWGKGVVLPESVLADIEGSKGLDGSSPTAK
jgi:hypothetical protein